MIFAQIKDSLIKNIIVIEDPTIENHFLDGFDLLIRIDNLSPVPGIGWEYDGSNFNPPSPLEEDI